MLAFHRRGLFPLLMASALMLFACSAELPPEELLERAQLAFDEDRLKAAVIDAKSVLRQDPSNAEGRRLLGDVNFRQRQLNAAAAEFERSLAGEKNPAVAALYADALTGSGQAEKVVSLNDSGFFDFAKGEPRFSSGVGEGASVCR